MVGFQDAPDKIVRMSKNTRLIQQKLGLVIRYVATTIHHD